MDSSVVIRNLPNCFSNGFVLEMPRLPLNKPIEYISMHSVDPCRGGMWISRSTQENKSVIGVSLYLFSRLSSFSHGKLSKKNRKNVYVWLLNFPNAVYDMIPNWIDMFSVLCPCFQRILPIDIFFLPTITFANSSSPEDTMMDDSTFPDMFTKVLTSLQDILDDLPSINRELHSTFCLQLQREIPESFATLVQDKNIQATFLYLFQFLDAEYTLQAIFPDYHRVKLLVCFMFVQGNLFASQITPTQLVL